MPPPELDTRRDRDFQRELLQRARAWIPDWSLEDGGRDFGRALLGIAARFGTEVAQRLDRAGKKTALGFLDWLAVRGRAARPARMPVVFKLADTAAEGEDVAADSRLTAGGVPFEIERPIRVVRGKLAQVVGVDAEGDAFYLPPPDLSSLAPLPTLPAQWQTKGYVAAGATKFQIDPALGLDKDMVVKIGGTQYDVEKLDNGILEIKQALAADAGAGAAIRLVSTFAPFEGARNRQEHSLYIGHPELLNLESAATIDVVGAQGLGDGVLWQYWGKDETLAAGKDVVGWQALEPVDVAGVTDAVVLRKPKGAMEPKDIGPAKASRWIRAYRQSLANVAEPLLNVESLELRINPLRPGDVPACPPDAASSGPALEAMANTAPLALTSWFRPLGQQPKQFDAFYLGCAEAFSKKSASVRLCVEMVEPTVAALAAVRTGDAADKVLAGIGKDRALHLFSLDQVTGALDNVKDREALQPGGATLDAFPAYPAPVWSEAAKPNDFHVATAAGDEIFVWTENAAQANDSAWASYGKVPWPSVPGDAVRGLVLLDDPVEAARRRRRHRARAPSTQARG